MPECDAQTQSVQHHYTYIYIYLRYICIKMMNNWIKSKTHKNDVQVKHPHAGSAVQSTQVSWGGGGGGIRGVKLRHS